MLTESGFYPKMRRNITVHFGMSENFWLPCTIKTNLNNFYWMFDVKTASNFKSKISKCRSDIIKVTVFLKFMEIIQENQYNFENREIFQLH